MKFIIECEHNYCRANEKELSEIFSKMYAIEDNLEFIARTLLKQYPNDPALGKIDNIALDLDNSNDEFYLQSDIFNSSAHLEVVTADIAESNDRDFLDDDEQDKYSLEKGILSIYTKLADTNYYFRFM